jgi:hypothetical protein
VGSCSCKAHIHGCGTLGGAGAAGRSAGIGAGPGGKVGAGVGAGPYDTQGRRGGGEGGGGISLPKTHTPGATCIVRAICPAAIPYTYFALMVTDRLRPRGLETI